MRLATPLAIVLAFSLALYTLQAYALQVATVVAEHTSTTTIRLVRVDGEG